MNIKLVSFPKTLYHMKIIAVKNTHTHKETTCCRLTQYAMSFKQKTCGNPNMEFFILKNMALFEKKNKKLTTM